MCAEQIEEVDRDDGAIECPSCHYEDNKGGGYDPEAVPWNDGECFEEVCVECGFKFEVCATVTIDHTMRPIEEEL